MLSLFCHFNKVEKANIAAAGPRIASLMKTHPFHPSQMFFKRLFNEEGVLNMYLALLSSPVPELRQQGMCLCACVCAGQ